MPTKSSDRGFIGTSDIPYRSFDSLYSVIDTGASVNNPNAVVFGNMFADKDKGKYSGFVGAFGMRKFSKEEAEKINPTLVGFLTSCHPHHANDIGCVEGTIWGAIESGKARMLKDGEQADTGVKASLESGVGVVQLIGNSGNTYYYVHQDGRGFVTESGMSVVAGQQICKTYTKGAFPAHLHFSFKKSGAIEFSDPLSELFTLPQVQAIPEMKKFYDDTKKAGLGAILRMC